jgi:hypothetical protein
MQPLICSGILLRLQDITACAIIASMPCICYAPLLMLSHLSAAAAIHEAGFHLEFSNGYQLFCVYCVVCVALCWVILSLSKLPMLFTMMGHLGILHLHWHPLSRTFSTLLVN